MALKPIVSSAIVGLAIALFFSVAINRRELKTAFDAVWMIVWDIDDTVLPGDMWLVPLPTRMAFVVMGMLGIERVVCSGSNLPRLLAKWECQDVACMSKYVDVIAYENGLEIIDTKTGRVMYSWGSQNETEIAAKQRWDMEIVPFIKRTLAESKFKSLFDAKNVWYRDNKFYVTTNTSGCAKPNETAAEIVSYLNSELAKRFEPSVFRIYPFKDAVDIVPPGANKAITTARIANIKEIPRKHIVVIGDSFNDVLAEQAAQGCSVVTYVGARAESIVSALNSPTAAVLPAEFAPPQLPIEVAKRLAASLAGREKKSWWSF